MPLGVGAATARARPGALPAQGCAVGSAAWVDPLAGLSQCPQEARVGEGAAVSRLIITGDNRELADRTCLSEHGHLVSQGDPWRRSRGTCQCQQWISQVVADRGWTVG